MFPREIEDEFTAKSVMALIILVLVDFYLSGYSKLAIAQAKYGEYQIN